MAALSRRPTTGDDVTLHEEDKIQNLISQNRQSKCTQYNSEHDMCKQKVSFKLPSCPYDTLYQEVGVSSE